MGVVLVLGAVLLGAVVTSRAGDTRPVVAAVRDLAAGTTLRAQDLRVVQVRLPGSRYTTAVSDAVGKTLTRPISSGELLPTSSVGRTPARTTLTVPLAAGAAPELRTGQRIELWLSTPSCAFVVLLPEVTVQSVRTADDGFGSGADAGQSVVISVEPAQVQRVVAAQAITDAKVRAGVLSGSSTDAARSAPATTAPTGSGLPADLAGCAADTSGGR